MWGLRIGEEVRARAEQAARQAGIPVSEWVAVAITSALGSSKPPDTAIREAAAEWVEDAIRRKLGSPAPRESSPRMCMADDGSACPDSCTFPLWPCARDISTPPTVPTRLPRSVFCRFPTPDALAPTCFETCELADGKWTCPVHGTDTRLSDDDLAG